MAATASNHENVWPGPSANPMSGSSGDAGAPAGWNTKRPEIALKKGLVICTEVRKNEPALPAVDPTTVMYPTSSSAGGDDNPTTRLSTNAVSSPPASILTMATMTRAEVAPDGAVNALLLVAALTLDLQGVEIRRFDRRRFCGRRGLRVMSLLALIEAADAQVRAVVETVELNFLKFAVVDKRIEPQFHGVAAKLGVDGEVAAVHCDVDVIDIHLSFLAAEKQLHHAL